MAEGAFGELRRREVTLSLLAFLYRDKYIKSETSHWNRVTATSAFPARCDGWCEPLAAGLCRELAAVARWRGYAVCGTRQHVGMKVI